MLRLRARTQPPQRTSKQAERERFFSDVQLEERLRDGGCVHLELGPSLGKRQVHGARAVHHPINYHVRDMHAVDTAAGSDSLPSQA